MYLNTYYRHTTGQWSLGNATIQIRVKEETGELSEKYISKNIEWVRLYLSETFNFIYMYNRGVICLKQCYTYIDLNIEHCVT